MNYPHPESHAMGILSAFKFGGGPLALTLARAPTPKSRSNLNTRSRNFRTQFQGGPRMRFPSRASAFQVDFGPGEYTARSKTRKHTASPGHCQ
eukprot:2040708-Rhodomonas_salina.1